MRKWFVYLLILGLVATNLQLVKRADTLERACSKLIQTQAVLTLNIIDRPANTRAELKHYVESTDKAFSRLDNMVVTNGLTIEAFRQKQIDHIGKVQQSFIEVGKTLSKLLEKNGMTRGSTEGIKSP